MLDTTPDFPSRWPDTWHLNPSSPTSAVMNVSSAWSQGVTGAGVTVVHVDSGLDHVHPDLITAYDASVSADLLDGDRDPFPVNDDDDEDHGTSMAGLAVARGNNSRCSVGVAYNARSVFFWVL